jgi:thiosulfate/3-mercaptopyruvate sulfurtransferase
MPGSISVPFSSVIIPENKKLWGKEKLHQIFIDAGLDESKPIITSCGTGVTAAVLDAALDKAQFGDPSKRRLYDGSWTEWAQRVKESEGLIVKTGEKSD